jgi:hypothetical protein
VPAGGWLAEGAMLVADWMGGLVMVFDWTAGSMLLFDRL